MSMGDVNVEILVSALSGNRLVEDYLAGDPRLAPFFPGSPFDAAAYRRKADEVRARFGSAALNGAAEAIRPVGREAAERLERIADGEGFVVTTGQQPGLFGGPLYTVHKTLSAIALARKLESMLSVPVLAVFWNASDDHDWEEANHVHLLDTANELHRLALDDGGGAGRSMGRRPLGSGAETALGALVELLPPSDFTAPILERLREAYGEGTVAAAFQRTLEHLFAGLPLGFVDAQAPAVRRQGEAVIRRELDRGAAHERALREQTDRLERAGYGAQVPILPGASNVFYEDDRGRERLKREDGGWLLRSSGRRLGEEELGSLVEEAPERFSANVVLRPVVESAVLPTLAYVGGPGEVSYLAQTRCLFEAHGVGMPLVYPRFSVTLVEGKVRKVLDKFGLEPESFRQPMHELIAEVVREDVPSDVESALNGLRQSLQEGYQAVYEAAKEIDATLKAPIFNARKDGFKGVADVERKIRQHVKLQNETGLEQLEKAAANLAPNGKPQERVLNVHQYLARYGEELIPAILERMDVRLESDGAGWTGVRCE